MTISLRAMLERAQSAHGSPYACVAVAAAAVPADSRLFGVYMGLLITPPETRVRRRAHSNPLAAARIVARTLQAKRVDPAGAGPAWGVVAARTDCCLSFAVRAERAWWASSGGGIAKVHVSRVVAAWEIV